MKKLLIIVLLLMTTSAFGQVQPTSYQTRVLIHPIVDLSDRWFLTGWIIGNTQGRGADNLNLLAGIGRRFKGGDVEIMFQQHWNRAGGNQRLIDIRLNQQLGRRWSLYGEAAPFLNRLALYDFVSIEANTTPRLSLGVETENVHQTGRDSLGAGPRAAYLLKSWPHAKLVLVGSYQFRRDEPNVARVYLILHLRQN